jgi:AcrR family transcriptional regulator
MPPAVTTERALRLDAAQNRERILAAAQEVFSERGLDASVAEIARKAGVGKATVFRSFPTKEHLIAAITCDRVRWVEELVNEALEKPDPWRAFEELLIALARRHATDLTYLEALAHDTNAPLLTKARAAANSALDRMMKRVKEQGTMRADATPEDLRRLFHGVTKAMSDQERHDVAGWERWAELFANALRAQPS